MSPVLLSTTTEQHANTVTLLLLTLDPYISTSAAVNQWISMLLHHFIWKIKWRKGCTITTKASEGWGCLLDTRHCLAWEPLASLHGWFRKIGAVTNYQWQTNENSASNTTDLTQTGPVAKPTSKFGREKKSCSTLRCFQLRCLQLML